MKVYTKNQERPIDEMYEMWHWMTANFGAPIAHNDNLNRWTYGKDTNALGTVIIGAWDIEWFDFQDDRDAVMFLLRWA